MLTVTGEVEGICYGRCERILTATSHPKIKEDDIESSHYVGRGSSSHPRAIDFVDKEIVEATFNPVQDKRVHVSFVQHFGMEVGLSVEG